MARSRKLPLYPACGYRARCYPQRRASSSATSPADGIAAISTLMARAAIAGSALRLHSSRSATSWPQIPYRSRSNPRRKRRVRSIRRRAQQDSNLRPLAPEASALSTELCALGAQSRAKRTLIPGGQKLRFRRLRPVLRPRSALPSRPRFAMGRCAHRELAYDLEGAQIHLGHRVALAVGSPMNGARNMRPGRPGGGAG